ncbi:MAG TPA: MFS transporter [Burkholderiaceae bacterium]|nr:MFS transporter [Burkholderiaceae bacterium]
MALAAHRRVFAAFFLYAFSFGGFYPRLAELQRTLGVSDAQLGLGLIGTACGTLISLTCAGPLLDRLGHRRVVLTLLPLVPLPYALLGHLRGAMAVFLCLLPAGILIGAIEVVVNLEADRVEHAIGRRIMNRAHAFWSFGFFGAGLLGSGAARLAISPQWHLALVVPLSWVLVYVFLGGFEAAAHRQGQGQHAASHLARPTPAIIALFALTLPALLLEGAGADWSAIYMRDVFGEPPFIGGLAVATGALAQACTRYVVDPFVERHGAMAVARTLLAILGVGCALVCFTPWPPAALLGFALMGVGTSAIFPLAMSAAAQRTDRHAAINVAALAQISFTSFLLGPPLLGFVAQHAGLRWAFGIGLPLILGGMLVTRSLAPPGQGAIRPAG